MSKIRYIRSPQDLSLQLKGFYERVAGQLGVDSLYVRQVAMGKRESALVEEALRQELNKILQRGIKTSSRHEVQFYADNAALLDRLTPFIAGVLNRGDSAVIVATNPHHDGLLERLKSDGVDVDAAIKKGMYVTVDALGTLSIFMVNHMPEPSRFFRIAGGLIEEAAKTGKTAHPRVGVFGEWVSILCQRGQIGAAIRLEEMWNQLTHSYELDLLCGYEMSSVFGEEHNRDFRNICAEHTAVYTQGE